MTKKAISGAVLIGYVFLTFYITVFSRTYHASQKHDFTPFWSYKAIQEGRDNLVIENFLNVLLFVPLGILLCGTFRRIKWYQVLLMGLVLSIAIETLQYKMKLGFSDFDDVFHNVIGCLVGFVVYKAVSYHITKRQNRSLTY